MVTIKAILRTLGLAALAALSVFAFATAGTMAAPSAGIPERPHGITCGTADKPCIVPPKKKCVKYVAAKSRCVKVRECWFEVRASGKVIAKNCRMVVIVKPVIVEVPVPVISDPPVIVDDPCNAFGKCETAKVKNLRVIKSPKGLPITSACADVDIPDGHEVTVMFLAADGGFEGDAQEGESKYEAGVFCDTYEEPEDDADGIDVAHVLVLDHTTGRFDESERVPFEI